MEDKWILINKDSGNRNTYYHDAFNQLADTCKSLLALNLDYVYKIEYWKDKTLEETDKMSDYFS